MRSLLLLAFPAVLAAQRPTVAVNVRVTDSLNAPIADADVAILRGLAQTVARTGTNGAGRASFTVARGDSALQVAVRKIGYLRAYRFFSTTLADTLTLDIRLSRAVTSLAPVVVNEREDLKRKSYHLTAEDLENSSRLIIDGADIFKLRPDMMNSRGGAKACEVVWTPRTGWIESVWVNGQRVTLPPVDSAYAASRKASLGINIPIARQTQSFTKPPNLSSPPPPWTIYSHMDSVLSVLRLIKPEHIEEVTYHDCFDASVGKNNSDLAMFIVLKPGIGFANGLGSYVIPPAQTTIDPLGLDTLPRHRFRLLGVFDFESGSPLEGVQISDPRSGNSTKTSATGTVSLFFVPDGTSVLTLQRAGYRDTTLSVTISPSDTMPLTFIMTKRR